MTKTQIFYDFEAYQEAIQDVDLNARLAKLYQSGWTLQQDVLGQTRIQSSVEGSGLMTEGALTKQGWGLYIPTGGNCNRVNGRDLPVGSVAIIPPGSEFRFSGQGEFKWMSVFVPNSYLSAVDAVDFGDQLYVTVVNPEQRVMGGLVRAIEEAISADDGEIAFRETALEASIVRFASSIFNQTPDEDSRLARTKVHQLQLIARAEEWMETCPIASQNVDALASYLCVSNRSLLMAFREQCGVSVLEFMTNRRLHLARRMLIAADPTKTFVAEIAFKCGFGDCGRFAGRYRKLFDELPSRTLAR